jgi:hypothetical protein
MDIIVRPQAGCREATVESIVQLLLDGVRKSMDREGRP